MLNYGTNSITAGLHLNFIQRSDIKDEVEVFVFIKMDLFHETAVETHDSTTRLR